PRLEVGREAVGEAMSFDHADLTGVARRHGVEVEEGWGPGKIIFELFEAVGEERLWEPTFVTHYPTEVSPLAARNREDPRVTDRFELFIAGSEYVNAFTELNDPEIGRASCRGRAQGSGRPVAG